MLIKIRKTENIVNKINGGQSNITKLHSHGATAFGIRLFDKFLRRK